MGHSRGQQVTGLSRSSSGGLWDLPGDGQQLRLAGTLARRARATPTLTGTLHKQREPHTLTVVIATRSNKTSCHQIWLPQLWDSGLLA